MLRIDFQEEYISKTISIFTVLYFLMVLLLLSVLSGCEDEPQTAGIQVNTTSSTLITSESGATTSFSIVLLSIPNNDVVIPLHSDNTNEGIISTDTVNFLADTEIRFTPNNWHIAQTVYIRGVNDNVPDGNVLYNVITDPASSKDGAYQSLDAEDVQISNASVNFDPVTFPSGELVITPTSALITSEDGSKNVAIQFTLNQQPSSDVTVSIESLDVSEGITQPNNPIVLVFTANNWDQNQSISVIGVDDLDNDGDILYRLAVLVDSLDSDFDLIVSKPIKIINVDDDQIGTGTDAVIVSPTAGLLTSESINSAAIERFSLRLNNAPVLGETVTVSASVSDSSEAIVSPGSVIFDDSNWQNPLEFTLKGVNDFIADGDQAYTVFFSVVSSNGVSSNYEDISVAMVQAVNIDDDTASIIMSLPVGGVITTENLATADFSVFLTSAPTADVVISASSLNIIEGTVSPASLTFSSNVGTIWNQIQNFTVTGVNDDVVDGDQTYNLSLSVSSADLNYDNLTLQDIPVINLDNDSPSISVLLPTNGIVTSEDLTKSTFNVVLNSVPLGDVMVSAVSLMTLEGRVTPPTLTFSSSGATIWNQEQGFVVTGVNDDLVDGSQAYGISLSVTSTDAGYDNFVLADVPAINMDNDIAIILVNAPSAGILTSEDGSSDSFSIALNSAPLADVIITATSLDLSEGTVSPQRITFSSASGDLWSQAQTFIVTGVSDETVDGDQAYAISLSVSSTDTNYSAIVVPNVPAINTDIDEEE